VYRAASEADFAAADGEGPGAAHWLSWLGVYRKGPATLELVGEGRVTQSDETPPRYAAARFEVPFGESQGWEAAILDHYQAMVFAICAKLDEKSSGARALDTTGGSTWSLDVWPGHPLQSEAKGTLSRIRGELEDLRRRVDAHNEAQAASATPGPRERVVLYVGQSVRTQ
jgi:hypothetical protein